MCEGIAAQKKLDDVGMRSMSLMSLEQMNNVAMVAKGEGESPAEALHEMHCEEGLEAYDDLNGDILDPKKMMEARMEEIKYFKEMDGRVRESQYRRSLEEDRGGTDSSEVG